MRLGQADALGEIGDLAAAIAGEQHRAHHAMTSAEMRDELARTLAGLIAEAERRRIRIVDEDHALETGRLRRQLRGEMRECGGHRLAPGDRHLPSADDAAQALARFLRDRIGRQQRDLADCAHHCRGQRMAAVLLEGGGEAERLLTLEALRARDLGQGRLAVGERARLVEDHRARRAEALEHRGILDDDAVARRERDRADDRHGHADEQRAGSRDHDDGEEPVRIAADDPAGDREHERDDGVAGTESIGETTHRRALPLGTLEHADDLRIAAVLRALARAQHQ